MIDLISDFFGTISDLPSLFYFTASLIIFIFILKMCFKLLASLLGFPNSF